MKGLKCVIYSKCSEEEANLLCIINLWKIKKKRYKTQMIQLNLLIKPSVLFVPSGKST